MAKKLPIDWHIDAIAWEADRLRALPAAQGAYGNSYGKLKAWLKDKPQAEEDIYKRYLRVHKRGNIASQERLSEELMHMGGDKP